METLSLFILIVKVIVLLTFVGCSITTSHKRPESFEKMIREGALKEASK
jgi:hypothetical protein